MLTVRFIGSVGPAEFPDAQADLASELAGLSPGFRHLVDFSQLESMEVDCSVEIGAVMPDLTGTPMKLLLPLLLRKDISVTIRGGGFVARQDPLPGTPIASGMKIVLELQ